MNTKKTTVVMSGIGAVGFEAARLIRKSADFELHDVGLRGGYTCKFYADVEGRHVSLYHIGQRGNFVERAKIPAGSVVLEFARPEWFLKNVEFYAKTLDLDFVIGTRGIALAEIATAAKILSDTERRAVIAPNMNKQGLAFQEFMREFAEIHPGLLKGYPLQISESRPTNQISSSYTAISVIGAFNTLGICFGEKKISRVRDKSVQLSMGVPAIHLERHGWRSYKVVEPEMDEVQIGKISLLYAELYKFLKSSHVFRGYEIAEAHDAKKGPDSITRFTKDKISVFSMSMGFVELKPGDRKMVRSQIEITNNENGTSMHAAGALDALRFLVRKEGGKGQIFNMFDVIEAEKEAEVGAKPS